MFAAFRLAARAAPLSTYGSQPSLSAMSISSSAVAQMKYRTTLKYMCESCMMVHRRGTNFITCSRDPRHKQKQVRRPNGARSKTYN